MQQNARFARAFFVCKSLVKELDDGACNLLHVGLGHIRMQRKRQTHLRYLLGYGKRTFVEPHTANGGLLMHSSRVVNHRWDAALLQEHLQTGSAGSVVQ